MAAGFRVLALACLLLGISVVRLHADPVTVTSGGLTIAWDDPSGFGFFAPERLALTGLFVRVASSPQQTCFTGCLPGTIVNLSSVIGGGTGFSLGQSFGAATVNGVNFLTDRYLNLAGTISFSAGDVTVPPAMPVGSPSPLLSAPFVFQGQVAGFAQGDVDAGTPLFEVLVQGAGTARLRLVPRPNGTYGFPEVSYDIEEPAPIPEPTTILLCATGLGAVVAGRRRARKARQTSGD